MSIFDHPDAVSAAPSWRCPQCRTLQAQTTQCWRCSKAAYSCETCHRYRPSVATGIGSCAKDPSREPVRADETRSCWEAAAAPTPALGLFHDPDVSPSPPLVFRPPAATVPPLRSAPGNARRASAAGSARKARPPLEDPGRAAWVEPNQDKLVDAPVVEPGGQISRVGQRRRRRRWFG